MWISGMSAAALLAVAGLYMAAQPAKAASTDAASATEPVKLACADEAAACPLETMKSALKAALGRSDDSPAVAFASDGDGCCASKAGLTAALEKSAACATTAKALAASDGSCDSEGSCPSKAGLTAAVDKGAACATKAAALAAVDGACDSEGSCPSKKGLTAAVDKSADCPFAKTAALVMPAVFRTGAESAAACDESKGACDAAATAKAAACESKAAAVAAKADGCCPSKAAEEAVDRSTPEPTETKIAQAN